MIYKIKWILKKWGQSIVELLAFFPGLLIIGIYAIPFHLIWIWLGIIPIYYFAGLLAGGFLKRNKRITYILFGMIVSGVGVYFLFQMNFYTILPWISGAVAFVRGIQLRGTRWEDIFPPAGLWVGFAAYFIGYFLFSRIETLKPFSPAISWAGVIYMVLVLFIINFTQLKTASLPGDKEPVLPHVIKKYNRLLITIVLLIIAAISFFNSLKEGVGWIISRIGYLIRRFFIFLAELFAPVDQGPPNLEGGGMERLFPPIKEKPPSIFEHIIEIIGIVLAIVAGLILLGLLGFALYRLFKKVTVWLSRFYQLGKDMEDYGGYVDEKESLIDFKKMRKDYAQRFRQWMSDLMEREPKWDELKTNKERIRYIYRHFLLRCMASGYSFKEYLTPAETGKELSGWQPEKAEDMEKLVDVYEDVRYGDKEIKDAQVEKLAEVFLKQ